jgi:polar amino acid transport system permease protein
VERVLASPRQREQAVRGGLYTLFIAGVIAIAMVGDWGRIQTLFLNPTIASSMFPDVITIAAKNVVLYTFAAFVFGLVFGLILALMRLSTIPPYRWVATAYIELFRGLPALVTLIGLNSVLPIAFGGFRVPGGTLGVATVGLGIVAAAYMAETIRAGIQAVPKGQIEAARSLGMSRFWAMTSIVIPQAFRIIIPPLTNEVVLLIKDTSLLFVLGTTPATKELLKLGRDAVQSTFNGTPFTVIALMYLLITLPLTRLVAALERRQSVSR